MSRRAESVLVVVYTPDSHVLLLQRQGWPEFWQSVTGALEAHELPGQAAARELKEETGLDHRHGNLRDCAVGEWFEIYPRYQHRYGPGVTRNYEHVFCFEVPQALPVACDAREHTQYQWLPKAAALSLAFSPTNRTAIERWVPAEGGL